MDTFVDGKFPNDWDYASVLSKVISCELSHSSSDDLCLRCRMKFSSNAVQTEAPKFVYLGILAINTLNELGILGTPATRIQRTTDRYHWKAPDNDFCEVTVVGMSASKSDHEYSYKTDFEIWRENQKFDCQNFQ